MFQNDSPVTHSVLASAQCDRCIIYLFTQDENVPPVSFLYLMRLNISEWPYILVGSICAMINGFETPAFSFFFASIFGVGAHLCSYIT